METIDGALGDIRAFCSVVELGTVSAAARQLSETKGSISRRVSRLERRLGTTLLARTPRAVTPTEEGLAFHARAREGLTLLDDAAENARRSRAVPRGHLRITAPHDLGLEVLPRLLVAFRRQHPQISIELLLSEATLDLAAHRIDLALRATVGPLPDMGYRASPMLDFAIRLYASPAYLASRVQPQQPQDLAGHELVSARVASQPSGRVELTGPREQKLTVAAPAAVEAGDFATVHRLLLAGAGIGPLPEPVAAESLRTSLLMPVLPSWLLGQARLHAITVAGAHAPARVQVFRKFLRQQLAELLSAES